MKVTNLVVGSIVVLIGVAQSASAQSQNFLFRCEQGKTFQTIFSPDRAILKFDDGKALLMRQIPAASGTQYKNAGYILATKGNEAFVTLDGQKIYQNCLTPSAKSALETLVSFQTPTNTVRVYRQGKQTLLQVVDRKNGAAWLRGVPLRVDANSQGTTYTTLRGENVVKVFQSQNGNVRFLQIGNNPPEMTEANLVSGSVSYRQRIALPPNATVRVQLQNVNRADAPAVTIAQQTIETRGRQVPIPFSVDYDPAFIDPTGFYIVRAQILIDNQLRWTSTAAYPVITQGTPTKNIEVIVNQVGNQVGNQ